MSKEMERIEAVLDEKVRPALRAHGGEIEIDYSVDMDDTIVGRNRFFIRVQEPRPSHISDIAYPN